MRLTLIMLYFDRPYMKIRWNETSKYIEIEKLAFVFGEPYREGMEKSLELARLKAGTRLLSDMRKGSVIVEEDMKWILEHWAPRAAAAGVRRIAVVMPASVVASMQMEQIHKKKGGKQLTEHTGMESELFADHGEAQRWLLTR